MQDILVKNEIKFQDMTGYPSIDKPWMKYYKKEYMEAEIPHMLVYEYLRSRRIFW